MAYFFVTCPLCHFFSTRLSSNLLLKHFCTVKLNWLCQMHLISPILFLLNNQKFINFNYFFVILIKKENASETNNFKFVIFTKLLLQQWRCQLDKWGRHIHTFVFRTISFFFNTWQFAQEVCTYKSISINI